MKITNRKLIFLGAVILLSSSLSMAIASAQNEVKCDAELNKQKKVLVLDSRVIDNVQNAKLTLGDIKKHPANPLFGEDKPWEPRFDNVYANVIYDQQDKIYKCWYSPFIIDERTTSTAENRRHPFYTAYLEKEPDGREMGICYATSKDGIYWDKPELGLVEFDGNKKNNIVMRGGHFEGVFSGPHGAGVFKDVHESDPAKRYKMFFVGSEMAVSFSADGIRWSNPIECPEIEANGDTHNIPFWAPDMGKYIGITRIKYYLPSTGVEARKDIRQVARTESKDFVNWTKAKVVLEGTNPMQQTHDMVVFPTGGIYIGLLGMMEYVDLSNYNVKQHIELAWSPDSVTWYRIEEGKPFIANSPAEKEHYGYTPYDWGTAFASAPIFLDDEIRIYYGACDWYFFDWRKGYLALATLRPDGWAGYEQISKDAPGVITTKTVSGDLASLCITADVKKGGSVVVTLVDRQGRELAHSKPIENTVTDINIKWKGDVKNLTSISDGEARLKFTLTNAKLYAFETK
jgi:hypothetical protein